MKRFNGRLNWKNPALKRMLASFMSLFIMAQGSSLGAISVVFAAPAAPGGTYTINLLSYSVNNLDLSLAGAGTTGTAQPYVGDLTDHNVQVNWGDGNVTNTSTVNFVDPNGTTAPAIFTGTWSNNHTYAAPGSYNITATLYQTDLANVKATTNITVVIPTINDENTIAACSDSLDNDGDTLIDLADPECASFQPQLVVVKDVVNDNGGTKVASDFTMNVTGTNVSQPSFAGNAVGTFVSLSNGAYSVDEAADAGYNKTLSADCSGMINVGDLKLCTVTNDDIQPTLTVTKVVINDDLGTSVVGDFPLFVNGNPVSSGVSNSLNAGTYDVSETNLPGYTASFSGDCNASGQVTLAPGENKTCVITNDDNEPPPPPPGTLIVIKNVVNDNGGTKVASDFTMNVTGTNVSLSSFPGDAVGTTVTVDPGAYSVDELADAGYAKTLSVDCAGNIASLETKTCTITNDDQVGTLTVTKVVTNDNGGSAVVADFPLFVNGNPVTSGTPNTLNTGTYTVSETNLGGYTGSFSGDCDAAGLVTLNAGENKTCTITNDDIPASLILNKVVNNNNGGTLAVPDFTLQIDGNSVSSGALNIINAGLHLASELNVSGYQGSGWTGDCAADGSITLQLGENKVCTITNDDIAGQFTVNLVVVNDNGGTAIVGDFVVQAGGVTVTPGVLVDTFVPGTYAVTASGAPAYAATFAGDCDAAGNLVLNLADNKVCTVTVDDVAPVITVNASVVNDNGGTLTVNDFALAVGGTPVTSGVAVNTFLPSTYAVTGNNQPAYAPTFSGDCDAGGNVVLALGDNKVCNVVFNDVAPTLTVTAVVTNDNGGTVTPNQLIIFFEGNQIGSGGTVTPGIGTFTTSFGGASGYTFAFGGDCNAAGQTTLALGDVKTCLLNLNDIAPGNNGGNEGGNNGGGNNGGSGNQGGSGAGGGGGGGGGGSGPSNGGNTGGSNGGNGTGSTPSTGNNGGSTPGNTNGGEVLGENTESPATPATPTNPPENASTGSNASCGIYLNEYIKYGAKNNPDEVTKLQLFLNEQYKSLDVPVDGFYGKATVAAVRKFQLDNYEEVLKPWGIKYSTGYVYKTTKRWVNMVKCPSLNLPMPQLP